MRWCHCLGYPQPGEGTGPSRSKNRWGCAAGHWEWDPKRSRQKGNLGPKRSNSVRIGSLIAKFDPNLTRNLTQLCAIITLPWRQREKKTIKYSTHFLTSWKITFLSHASTCWPRPEANTDCWSQFYCEVMAKWPWSYRSRSNTFHATHPLMLVIICGKYINQ